MKRRGWYMVIGFAVALAETGTLLTELGHDIEGFGLKQVGKLRDGTPVHAAIH